MGLLPAFLLLGCKDNEEAEKPMKKLESITWSKNNSPTREGAIKIIYNGEGNLSLIEEYNQSESKIRQYSYSIKKESASVSCVDYRIEPVEVLSDYRVLSLNRETVYTERFNVFNEYNGTKEAYSKDKLEYIYQGGQLSSINWTATVPDGSRYDEIKLDGAAKFEYLNGNLSELKWSADINNRKKMEITYSDISLPANLPLRFTRLIDLDTWDMFDPLNIYYGAGSQQLPSTIKVIDISSGNVDAEYTFTPSMFEGYLMDMEIMCDKSDTREVYTYIFKYRNSL